MFSVQPLTKLSTRHFSSLSYFLPVFHFSTHLSHPIKYNPKKWLIVVQVGSVWLLQKVKLPLNPRVSYIIFRISFHWWTASGQSRNRCDSGCWLIQNLLQVQSSSVCWLLSLCFAHRTQATHKTTRSVQFLPMIHIPINQFSRLASDWAAFSQSSLTALTSWDTAVCW